MWFKYLVGKYALNLKIQNNSKENVENTKREWTDCQVVDFQI